MLRFHTYIIHVYIYIYMSMYIHMCVSCPIIFTMRLALPHGTSLCACVPPRKKYIARFQQQGFTQMSLHDKSSKHILNTKWHHQVSRFRIFVIRRYVMHSLQQRHPPIRKRGDNSEKSRSKQRRAPRSSTENMFVMPFLDVLSTWLYFSTPLHPGHV